MTKTEINKALKEIGFGFVKMNVNSFKDKTHHSKTKGLKGGSIGPMTVTDAHHTHNANVIDKVRQKLINLGGTDISDTTIPRILFPISRSSDLVYTFSLDLFPTYAHNDYDPGYQTYWLTCKSELIKR